MGHLVLLGGGHAHLQVLRALAASRSAGTRVTLVSPHVASTYSGMLPGVIAGHYAPSEAEIALAPLAARAGADFLRATATGLCAGDRQVAFLAADGSAGRLDYDLLSIGIGGASDRASIPGARDHAMFVRPVEGFASAVLQRLVDAPGGLRHVVVIGAGAGGFELALALRFRVGPASSVCIVAGDAPLLPGHAPGVRARAARALERRGIDLLQGACVAVAADHVQLAGGRRVPCDLALVVTGSRAPAWLQESGLALDNDGFVATSATLQSVSHGEVFAAGDIASRADAPRPRSGVYAVRAGPPLAENLLRALAGRALRAWRPQHRALNLLSCGDRDAIASWGGWSAEGRAMWWLKDRIDRRFVALNRAA